MIQESRYAEYVHHLLDGDRDRCREIVLGLVTDGVGIRELYIGLFQKSLYEVGKLWETNKVSVATEHMATAITESLLPLVYPTLFKVEHKDCSAVIACVTNEYHQIGGRMVADTFEMHRWHGYFVGANAPVQDLLQLIQFKRPTLVGLSLSIISNVPRLIEAIESIRECFPNLRVIVGGQGLAQDEPGVCGRFPNVEYIATLDDLDQLIENES